MIERLPRLQDVEIGGRERLAVRALDEGRAPVARVVAGPGALHLHDVRAEIGEQLAGPWPGEDAGELEDAQAVEGR